jgi:hypothetical protein
MSYTKVIHAYLSIDNIIISDGTLIWNEKSAFTAVPTNDEVSTELKHYIYTIKFFSPIMR